MKLLDNEEEIIVAAWNPHYMFAKYDIKYIDDPKGVYGGEEYITTIARKGLKEDMPEAYEILDNFFWEVDDMESIMLAAQEKTLKKQHKIGLTKTKKQSIAGLKV